jgi:hypothetical protein
LGTEGRGNVTEFYQILLVGLITGLLIPVVVKWGFIVLAAWIGSAKERKPR